MFQLNNEAFYKQWIMHVSDLNRVSQNCETKCNQILQSANKHFIQMCIKYIYIIA